MKKFYIALIFSIFTVLSIGGQSFNTHFGLDLVGEGMYLDFGGAFITTVSTDTELELGASIGLETEDVKQDDGSSETKANFLIPVSAGLNFLFPLQQSLDLLVGISLEPSFVIPAEGDFQFLMGPAIKVGGRLKIHDNLKWFAEAKESLLIGPPDWINPKTTIITGFNFTL